MEGWLWRPFACYVLRDALLAEAFPPGEAKRLANKLEIHHTPKHGTWLNMAKAELSVLSRQSLAHRIPDRGTPRRRGQCPLGADGVGALAVQPQPDVLL